MDSAQTRLSLPWGHFCVSKRTSLPADADIASETATSLTENTCESTRCRFHIQSSLLQLVGEPEGERPESSETSNKLIESFRADPALIIGWSDCEDSTEWCGFSTRSYYEDAHPDWAGWASIGEFSGGPCFDASALATPPRIRKALTDATDH